MKRDEQFALVFEGALLGIFGFQMAEKHFGVDGGTSVMMFCATILIANMIAPVRSYLKRANRKESADKNVPHDH